MAAGVIFKMKQCPKCSRQYLDDTLNFCLDDGEWLRDDDGFADSETIVMPPAYISSEPATRILGNTGQAIGASKAQERSIAVLPFAHLSNDPDDEYFCDGLAEELLNTLARIDGLKVAARTSAFSFKGKDATASEIGRTLGVSTILEGSVRKSGDALRINIQLVNAADGYQIWSERYDREMRNVFDLQDDLTKAVVSELKTKLLGDVQSADLSALVKELKHFRSDIEAYQVYLRGRFFLNKFTAADALRSVDLFNEALALDPTCAPAYAGLADAYIMLTEMGPMPPHEAMPMAKAAAEKALSLDNKLAEAYSALGMVLQDYEYDFEGAEREFKRAIELGPNNPIPRQSYGILLTELGRFDEAEVQFAKVFEVDPLSVVANWIYSFCLFLARRYDDALNKANNTLELDPNFGVAYLTIAFSYQMKGEYDKSVEAYARCSEVMGFPENAEFVRESYKDGWAAFLLAMASRSRPMTFSSYIIAVFAATLGDTGRAFEELEASYEKRESHIVMMNVDPRFEDIRLDRRFQELVRTIGFPA